MSNRHQAAALVVGFTIQGLALARSLANRGIRVFALERRRGPTSRTRFAHVLIDPELRAGSIVDCILRARAAIDAPAVVLFPASDFTVREVIQGWDRLDGQVNVSWAASRDQIARLTDKREVDTICQAAGIRTPRTIVLSSSPDERAPSLEGLEFPIVLKPARPPGEFKAIVCDSRAALNDALTKYTKSFPLLAQEFVPGDDDTLFFCSMYLDRGSIVASLVGRKRLASPTRTGRGIIMESYSDHEIPGEMAAMVSAAELFVSRLDMTGPISIEFKRDPRGQFWLIEPNAGRTEYCVDLLIQSGFDLPYIEFLKALELDPSDGIPTHLRGRVWYDTDREPLCYLLTCLKERSLRPFGKSPVFPFLGHRDLKPMCFAASKVTREISGALIRRARRMLRDSPAAAPSLPALSHEGGPDQVTDR